MEKEQLEKGPASQGYQCLICQAKPRITFNAPSGGERGTCLFCDCPTDIKICQWFDKYERFGVKSKGWLAVPICDNCIKPYLNDKRELDFGGLLLDSGVA